MIASRVSRFARGSSFFALIAVAFACGSSSTPDDTSGANTATGGGDDTSSTSGTSGGDDAGAAGDDASQPSTNDASTTPDAAIPNDPTDGTPTRQSCTSHFGSALDTSHGRLDGYLVSIVGADTTKGCNDDSHLHLQIQVSGSIYDVAVNLDTQMLRKDGVTLPNGAWSEGWHPNAAGSLSYTSLGMHLSDFTQQTGEIDVENALANANHVSIYATGYGPTGVHDVHFRGSGLDGAIVIDPLGPTNHVLFFCFTDQSF